MSTTMLRVLQVGGGSMGTRRLRDLSERADVKLALFDERSDRRERARERFGIEVFPDWSEAMAWRPQALVISTPPDRHQPYVDAALEHGWHHFCEAHVWTPNFERVEAESARQKLVAACSRSMVYLPVVRKLKELVSGELGELHAYQMFLSTWLPDWHPSERNAFYAWNRATCAAREMVPFELSYLSDIFGLPIAVAGSVARRGQLEADSEDTWTVQMRLNGGGQGQLAVLMASPTRYRCGSCFGTRGGLTFDITSGEISHLRADGSAERHSCGAIRDVVEPGYREEIHAFIEAVHGQAAWPYGYRDSAWMTGTLAAAEASQANDRWVNVDPRVQPAEVPPPCDQVAEQGTLAR